jgi:hypothetical protein
MKVLLVVELDPWVRSVSTVHRYVAAGRRLGHDIVVYGEANAELPQLPFTTDLSGIDLALFIVQVPNDFPDMPYLARLLDGIPRERRVVLDIWGRYNETIRLDHDFNHLEKIDAHLEWEWVEAMDAVSDHVLQPTLSPVRLGAKPFLFHGFDPEMVAKPYASAKDAAAAWRSGKSYGAMYVGNNWHRWHQLRAFLDEFAQVRDSAGKFCLTGWDWRQRPNWAIESGIAGVDTDPDYLEAQGVEVRDGVRFDEVISLLGTAKFAPVLHRPLFKYLNLVTNRTFETFCADTVPVLMLPHEFVSAIYGKAALALVPSASVADHLKKVLSDPEPYWDAVLQTRKHLAQNHSFERRIAEIEALLAERKPAGSGGAR